MMPGITDAEYIYCGHTACPGCGSVLALRYTLKALGKQTVIALTASCSSAIAGAFPYTSLSVPVLHCAFASGAVTAAGVKAGLELRGDKDTSVITWAGDGGTFDIGMQALSAAAERDDDIIFVCNDNEAYMNTGIQKSAATPIYASTTTTPKIAPKNTHKKDIVSIMVAHRIPYAATACIAFPHDLITKVSKARAIKGMKLIHILAPCPTGWGFSSDMTIDIARLAVRTRLFPLYEVEYGKYNVTVIPESLPVKDYLVTQGRFKHISLKNIEKIQHKIYVDWEELLHKADNIKADAPAFNRRYF